MSDAEFLSPEVGRKTRKARVEVALSPLSEPVETGADAPGQRSEEREAFGSDRWVSTVNHGGDPGATSSHPDTVRLERRRAEGK